MGIASKLDRQVKFRRAVMEDDGYGNVVAGWEDLGGPVWALREDVKDSEKFAASLVQATLTSRFLVRSTEFTRGITPADELVCEGETFDITGLKQAKKYGRHQLIEISAWSRTDGP